MAFPMPPTDPYELFYCNVDECATYFVVPHGAPVNHVHACPLCGSQRSLHMGNSCPANIDSGAVILVEDRG